MSAAAAALDRVPLRALYPERFAAVRYTDTQTHTPTIAWIDEHADDDDEDGSLDDEGVHRAAAAKPSDEARRLRALAVGPDGVGRVAARRAELRRQIRGVNARVLYSANAEQSATTDPTFLHETNEVTWWRAQVEAVERISTASPMVASCLRLLKQHVLRDGIKFTRENVELVPSADFEQYVVSRLHPFVHQAIDALMQIGIVPIVYELDPETGQRWPYVPAIGTYVIRMYRVRGATRYRFFWLDEQTYAHVWRRQVVRTRDAQRIVQWTARRECDQYSARRDDEVGGIEDPTVEVLHNLGYDLASDGALTSKCATALNVVVQRMRSQAARMTAESLQAAPPVATEYNHQAEAQQSRNLAQGYYVSASTAPGSQLSATDLANRSYVRDRSQQAEFASMLRTYEQMSGRDASGEFGVPREQYSEDLGGTAVVQPATAADGTQAQWANQYHVTQSRQLVSLPAAHTQTDHVTLLDHLDDQICSVFGVPRTYVQGSALRAGTDLVTDRLEHEVTGLRRIMSDVLTRVYNQLFLTDDAARLTRSIERRAVAAATSGASRRRRLSAAAGTAEASVGALVNERDLFVSEAIRRVRVTFSKPPARDMQELLTMYGLGAIDRRMLCGEFARRNGFDPAQMCDDGESELPTEARRHLIPQLADYHKFQLAREQAKAQQKQAKEQLAAQKDQAKQQAKVQIEQAKAQVAMGGAAPTEPGGAQAGDKRKATDSGSAAAKRKPAASNESGAKKANASASKANAGKPTAKKNA